MIILDTGYLMKKNHITNGKIKNWRKYFMITLIRLYMIKAKEIKYKLAFWKIVDNTIAELAKHPEELEKKLIDSVVRLVIGNKVDNEIKA